MKSRAGEKRGAEPLGMMLSSGLVMTTSANGAQGMAAIARQLSAEQ
ncbi:MAG: hypothetical protein NXI15_13965 [Gammaproteobacteria bacterium]|nr:hypothetical protein [Gammaproteobacteria bacterium]